MKSKLWIFAAIVLIASMALAACQPQTVVETVVVEKEKQVVSTVEVTKQVEVEKIVEVTPTPLPKGVTKITIFVGFGTGTSPEQQAVHKQLQDLYNSTHSDIQIEFLTVPWADRQTKYATMLAAGQPPDIAMPIGVGGLSEFYKGWLDLTPFIEADNYDMTRFAGKTVDIHNYPGQGTLGLPLCVYPSVVFYNSDIFDAAGVDYPPHKWGEAYADGSPWTYDTLVEVAKKLTLDANGNDANSPAFDTENIVQFGWDGHDWGNNIENAREWGDEPGTGVSTDGTKSLIDTQQYKDYLTWLKDTVWTWHIRANNTQSGAFYANAGDPMGSGQVGMWDVNTWMGYAWPSWSEKFTWDMAAVPQGPNGKVIAMTDADTAVIPAASLNPNEAWEVMKWFFEPEQYDVLIANYSCLPADKVSMSGWAAKQAEKYPGVDFQVALDAMDYSEPSPNHESWKPNYSKVNTELSNLNGEILNGTNLDIDALVADYNARVQALIDEYWAANPQ
jgi:multiple sugar transport system substrate-binding protein